EIVGNKKTIDTNKFNILSIDTLGNGYATQSHTKINTIENIRIGDIAKINLWLLEELRLTNIHALIGGSLGGVVAWEMWQLNPNYFDKLRSEEHTSELQSRENLVCRLLLEKKNKKK